MLGGIAHFLIALDNEYNQQQQSPSNRSYVKAKIWSSFFLGAMIFSLSVVAGADTIKFIGSINALEEGHNDNYNLLGDTFLAFFWYDSTVFNESRDYPFQEFGENEQLRNSTQFGFLTGFLLDARGGADSLTISNNKLKSFFVFDQVWDGAFEANFEDFGTGNFRVIFDTAYGKGITIYTGVLNAIPEPGTYLLMGIGMAFLFFCIQKKL